MASGPTRGATPPSAGRDRPDVFLSYAREDKDFAERRLTKALEAYNKDVWVDFEDIRGGASDWRASVWAGIESATVVVFVLTPDSVASSVCGEELQRAVELNKRIIPVVLRSVEGLSLPSSLARPNWIFARAEDDFDESVSSLVAAIELDEAWVEQHARLAQRTGEWLRHDRDGSYLLRGSDLRSAERWLDDQGAHHEAPTADQITYVGASRRAAARRQRGLLAGAGVALVSVTVLAVIALAQRSTAIDRERTARAQARSAQSIAALALDPEESVRDALEAVDIRPDDSEARYALRRAVSASGWTSILRIEGSRGLLDVEFTEDGRRVATAGEDGKAAVWNTRTGRRVALVTRRGRVNTVQFSPDGRQLLTASEDGTARTWDASTRRRLHVFDTKSHKLWAATYGADGRLILTGTPGAAQVWDATSGARLARLPNEGEYRGTIRLSLDGRRALTSGDGGKDAWLWNVATRRRIATLSGDRGDPLSFSLFSGDARRIATLGRSGALSVWNGKGQPLARFPPPPGGLGFSDADLSRDGRRVLRADGNGDVEVWDVVSRHRILLHPGRTLASAQFDRSGEYVVTGGDDGVAQVWQVNPPRDLAVLRGHTAAVRRARFSPDGTRVVTASDDGSARLWPALPQMPADPGWQRAESTAFGPNSRDVLVVDAGRRAVWNTANGKVVPLQGGIFQTDVATWPCGRAAGCSPWSPDGRFVAGANADGQAVIWNARTGVVTRSFGRKKFGTVSGAAFSPDGRRLVVVDGERRTARIWNVATGRPEAEVPGRRAARGKLWSAQFVTGSPLRVLTVDALGNVQLSDPATATSVALGGSALPVGVAAAADGRHVAVGTEDGELRLFSGAGHLLQSGRATNGGSVSSLAFDPAGTTIVTGGQKGTVATWDTRTLARSPLAGLGEPVTGATFSPDGNFVLLTSDATASLWDRTLKRVVLALPQSPAVRAELSPDASRIVLAGETRLEVVRCDACAPLGELFRRARSLLPAGD